MDPEISVELDCSVCGANGEIHTESPIQWQAFFEAWNVAHKHTAQELADYYKAESADVP